MVNKLTQYLMLTKSCIRVLLYKLTVVQLVKKFSYFFMEPEMFIAVTTGARY